MRFFARLAALFRRLVVSFKPDPLLTPWRELADLTAPTLEIAKLTDANGLELYNLRAIPETLSWTQTPP